MVRPSRCMNAPAAPGSSSIMGEPWETKSEGRGVSIHRLEHAVLHASFEWFGGTGHIPCMPSGRGHIACRAGGQQDSAGSRHDYTEGSARFGEEAGELMGRRPCGQHG